LVIRQLGFATELHAVGLGALAALASALTDQVALKLQEPPVTRPEAIRGMIDAMLHILAKDPGEKPAKKAKTR
jgi:hypothetical protein